MAATRTAVLAWARPERFVTLTQAPDEWQPLRAKVRKTRLRLANLGYDTHWAWTVEVGKRTGMKHVHLLQHGDYIPQRTLAAVWGRRVDIRKVGDAGATGYAMKEARRVTGYVMKDGRRALAAHLDRNGGRPCHLSRRYLRGYRVREVEQLIRPSEGLTWVLVPCTVSIDEGQAIASTAV